MLVEVVEKQLMLVEVGRSMSWFEVHWINRRVSMGLLVEVVVGSTKIIVPLLC